MINQYYLFELLIVVNDLLSFLNELLIIVNVIYMEEAIQKDLKVVHPSINLSADRQDSG
jgi:hypothetical protein